MKTVVYQIGARRHFAVARGLYENNTLQSLYVDAAETTSPWKYLASIPKVGSLGFIRSISTRRVSGVPPSLISGQFPFVVRNILGRAVAKNQSAADRWVRQNQLFCRSVPPKSWFGADAVYCYNGAALEIFERAKSDGKRCILDQTAAPWRWNTNMLRSERLKWPDWESAPSDIDERGAMILREEREWELADRIICGSQFVIDCIRDIQGPHKKCRMVPYPTATVTNTPFSHHDNHNRCRVLFVGTLQLRKGVQYLYEAMRQLAPQRFEVRLVGPNLLTSAATARLREAGITVVGSVPRDAVNREYANADLFVLPTLSEGSANVCHEAKGAGLPVITTAAAGIVAHSQLTLVPSADSVALAEAIQQVAKAPRIREPTMEKTRTVEEYGKELLEAIRDSGELVSRLLVDR